LQYDSLIKFYNLLKGPNSKPTFSKDKDIQKTPIYINRLFQLRRGEVFASIDAGFDHIIALTTCGRVFSWGRGDSQQLVPKPLGLSNIVYIACGYFHSFAIDVNDCVWVWGNNNHQQTGITQTTRRSIHNAIITPTKATALTGKGKIRQICAAMDCTIILFQDGTVYMVGGANDHEPFEISGLSDICSISTNVHHNMALDKNGDVFVWDMAGENVQKIDDPSFVDGRISAISTNTMYTLYQIQ
jgi:alpha-tubulin suppressor-like RCC1 family protein